MIPDSFKQDLLNRVDVVELIERYVPLRKGGANYVACCPFHSEKSPSFTVSPTKQFYHCFGCGAHGNAISFLMEYQGLGYIDALKDLASSVGMKLPEWEGASRKESTAPDLTEITDRAWRYYREQLKTSPQAIEYLKGRGLTGKIAAHFGIGYAPPGWQNLQAVFTDYDGKEIKEAGLVIDAEGGGRRYDRFRDRIMFPILNQRGTVIGFGGRVLGAGEPKYLNSPETPLFSKGNELYGLPQARNAIRAESRVLVVEGYMDVVALAQHGIEHAVATLGTATTPVHLQKLFRTTDEVVFCFDGDAAGRRAAWHALEVTLPVLADGKVVRFMFLPEEHDPDSFVRARGDSAFRDMISRAQPLSEYFLEGLQARVAPGLHLRSPEAGSKVLAEAEPLYKKISAPVLKRQLQRLLLEATGLTVGTPPPAARYRGFSPPPAKLERLSVEARLQQRMLAYILASPKVARILPRDLFYASDPLDGTILAVADYIAEHVEERSRHCGPMVLEHFGASAEHLPAIQAAQTSIEADFSADEAEAEFAAAIEQRRVKLMTTRVSQLRALVEKRAASPDEEREYALLSMRARPAATLPASAVTDP